uniref:Uncharacterized protein n=1 Tax=Panagrolaimus sp. ES5 TaxID=591445 RepID=A0AC34FYB9_9BILA
MHLLVKPESVGNRDPASSTLMVGVISVVEVTVGSIDFDGVDIGDIDGAIDDEGIIVNIFGYPSVEFESGIESLALYKAIIS